MTQEQEILRLQNELSMLRDQYNFLFEKVKKMLDAQQAYFKSNKDIQLLKVSKAIEKEVKDFIQPKQQQVSQGTIDWLAS